jgi:GDP-L-fucose synthase
MSNAIFLAGGNGFLGRHIKHHLAEKYRIYTPVRQDLNYADVEAVNKYFADLGEVECILNAANVGGVRNSLKSEQECLFENAKVFRNMFTQRYSAKRFIQFGSGAEYSKPFYKPNMTEKDVGHVIPMDAYGMAKFFSGQALENLGSVGRSVNLRIFGVFGSGEDYTIRFISNAIVRSLFDLPIIVNQNAEFDYVYIDDFVKILDYFIGNPAPYISYNITTGTSITLVELAGIVKNVTHNPHDIIIKNKSIKESYTGNNTRLREFLPKEFTFTPMKTAIKELVVWYETQMPNLNKELLI